MNSLPRKCVIDTNVPITANLSSNPKAITSDLADCVMACIEAVEHVLETKGLIIDAGDEIFDEYRRHLSMKGEPGIGDRFLKWVHDNRWNLPDKDRVCITKNGETYREFPDHPGLIQFDISDRKFVAVSNAHPNKPPIVQATDCKWWGWKQFLEEVGIKVIFLCPGYVKVKHAAKGLS
ncbi:MAG: hypothetical protein ACC613_03720 [Synergistales bacterium]